MSETGDESNTDHESLIQKILYNPVFRVCSVLILAVFIFPDGIFSFIDEAIGVIALVVLVILYIRNPRPRTTRLAENEPEPVKKCPLCKGTDIINGICQGCGTKVD